MGRVTKPRYALHFRCTDSSERHYTGQAWQVRAKYGRPGDGQPTPANIDRWVTAFEQSRIDGANKHLGIASVVEAWIVDQENGNEVVARWVRSEMRKDEPKFQII